MPYIVYPSLCPSASVSGSGHVEAGLFCSLFPFTFTHRPHPAILLVTGIAAPKKCLLQFNSYPLVSDLRWLLASFMEPSPREAGFAPAKAVCIPVLHLSTSPASCGVNCSVG